MCPTPLVPTGSIVYSSNLRRGRSPCVLPIVSVKAHLCIQLFADDHSYQRLLTIVDIILTSSCVRRWQCTMSEPRLVFRPHFVSSAHNLKIVTVRLVRHFAPVMNSTNINVSHHCTDGTPVTTKVVQDPTAVKALLDQLKASQVWQDTLSSTSSHVGPGYHGVVRESPASTLEDVQGESNAQSSDALPSPSVASLLSQLRTSIATNTPPVSNTRTAPNESSRDIPRPSQELPPTRSEHLDRTPRPVAATSSTRVQDIRSLSFQQALPHLTQLASDPAFLTAVSRVRFIHYAYSHTLFKWHLAAARTKRTRTAVVGRTTGYT